MSTKKSKIWIYNYDFEFELAKLAPTPRQNKFLPWHFLNRSSNIFLPLTDPHDQISTHEMPDIDLLSHLEQRMGVLPTYRVLEKGHEESNAPLKNIARNPLNVLKTCVNQLVPWGWSPQAIKLNNHLADKTRRQSLKSDLISYLNSKQTSNDLRNHILPKSFQISSMNISTHSTEDRSLRQVIEKFASQYPLFYIKHYFGTSGQLSGSHTMNSLSEKVINKTFSWIRQSGGILLEKSLDIKREFSLQYEFYEDHVSYLGVSLGRYTNFGSYQGSFICQSLNNQFDETEHSLIPIIKYLRGMHYQGPLGIDLIETSTGEIKFLEINARFTMGRLALEWHKKINPHEYGIFFNRFDSPLVMVDSRKLLGKFKRLEERYDSQITLIHHCNYRSNGKNYRYCTVLLSNDSKNRLHDCENRLHQLFKTIS